MRNAGPPQAPAEENCLLSRFNAALKRRVLQAPVFSVSHKIGDGTLSTQTCFAFNVPESGPLRRDKAPGIVQVRSSRSAGSAQAFGRAVEERPFRAANKNLKEFPYLAAAGIWSVATELCWLTATLNLKSLLCNRVQLQIRPLPNRTSTAREPRVWACRTS